MSQRYVLVHAPSIVTFAVVLCGLAPGRLHPQGQGQYPQMAPLDQYLIADRQAEIALARSAAPPAIADQAKVLVLGKAGYETAAAGKNGFVCLVERAWTAPFDFPNFWSPKIRAPICYNPPAARSVLPLTLRRTTLALAGRSKQAMLDTLRAGAHPHADPGAMAFMLSKQGLIDDSAGAWRPHLMVFAPLADSTEWAAGVAGSPVLFLPMFVAEQTPIAIYVVPVVKWSDGTAAPQ